MGGVRFENHDDDFILKFIGFLIKYKDLTRIEENAVISFLL